MTIDMENEELKVKMSDTPEDWYQWLFKPACDVTVDHIRSNLHNMERAFQSLLPGKTIIFVENEDFYIHSETGTLLSENTMLPKAKGIRIEERRIKIWCDFNTEDFKGEFVYIMDWRVGPNDSIYLRCAEYSMPTKKTVTFTIDAEVISRFSSIADKMAINKSKFVENMLRNFVEKNS